MSSQSQALSQNNLNLGSGSYCNGLAVPWLLGCGHVSMGNAINEKYVFLGIAICY